MMEPTQHRKREHLVLLVRGKSTMHWQGRNLLPKPLVGSSLIEIQDRGASGGGGVASHGRLGNDPGILASRSPENVRREHLRGRVRYGVRSTLMPLVVATRAKCDANFLSFSRIRYVGVCPEGVASRNCCATQASVVERVTFTWMTFRDFSSTRKKAKSGRKKRSATWKKSQAQTSAA